MKYNSVNIGTVCRIERKHIAPQKGTEYTLYSLPAFDNAMTPEVVDGEVIKSGKLAVHGGMILYNKLNVKYKRVWNVHETAGTNNVCSTEFFPLVVNPQIMEQDFLYYQLTSEEMTNAMHGARQGTSCSQQRISEDAFFSHIISCPSLGEQKRIASILSSIDGKIAINRAINDNLQQQAFEIFNALFPNCTDGEMCVGHYIIPRRGKNLLTKDAVGGDVPVVAGGLEPSTYHNVANTVPPVITISASGANAGFTRLWHIPVWSSDSSYIDATMTDAVYFWYALIKRRQREVFDMQTGSAQAHIYPQNIAAMPIPQLDKQLVHEYSATVTPLFDKIGTNIAENCRLAALRDTLLPKLMSGEIDVSKVEI